MDYQTVFSKTREGEKAVRERIGPAQRNLRSILIMVDGLATAADLARRFGDEDAALAALAELQAGGFIVELGNPPASAPMAGKEESSFPDLSAEVSPATPGAPSETAPAALPKQGTSAPAWLEGIGSLLRGMRKKTAAGTGKAVENGDDQAISAVDLAPIRRGSIAALSWLVLFSMLGIAVLAVLTFVFYPYGRHLPVIERSLSSMLKDPVKIGDIGISFLPRPHIVLRDIKVGRDAHLAIASARAVPDFLSLLGDRKVLHQLTLERVTVKHAGLSRLAQAGAAPVDVRSVALRDLSLAIGDVRIDGGIGEIQMAAAGVAESIRLRNADGTLRLEMHPAGGAFRMTFVGNDWTSPFGPKLTFHWIEGQGELRSSALELGRIDGKAYEGLIEGRASLGWEGNATLAGEFELKRMNTAGLLAALGSDIAAEGELSGRLKLAASAGTFGKLSDALRAEGVFELKRGAARGFDIGEAVRARTPTRGGETRFELLSGDFLIDGGERRLDNLRLASGLLKAGGRLGTDRDGRLNGALDIEIRGSTATQKLSLAVGGTAKDPVLTPSRGK